MCATPCLLRQLPNRVGNYLEESRNNLEGERTVRLSYGDLQQLSLIVVLVQIFQLPVLTERVWLLLETGTAIMSPLTANAG